MEPHTHTHTDTHRHTQTHTHRHTQDPFIAQIAVFATKVCICYFSLFFFCLFLKNRQRVAVRGRAVFAHLKWSADAFRRCMSRPLRCGSALPDPCLPHGHLTHRTDLPAPLPLPGPVMVSIRGAARRLPRCWSPW